MRKLGPVLLSALFLLAASQPAASAEPQPQPPSTYRDGSRDFDFNLGVWRSRLTRLEEPLSGSTRSVEMNGTVSVRPVWGGRAQLEEIDAEGPEGRWQGLTLFLYNPTARQWRQVFGNVRRGVLEPPLVGGFASGRGELVAHDTLRGKAILVKGVWSAITADAHRYEEHYSNDGGATWERVLTANLTRDPAASRDSAAKGNAAPEPVAQKHEGSADFDFDIGTWRTHSSRLSNPLTGSTTWTEWHGSTVVRKVWGGRANLAEFSSEGPTGRLELLSLRLFNPQSRQWSLHFSTPGAGTLSVPMVGEFGNGRGVFYSQEAYRDRTILVRFTMFATSASTAQSEQAFSDDGGKTWETNWINRYTRVE